MLPFLPKVMNFNKRYPLNSRSGILGCQPMTKKELTSDILIYIWRQSRCSIVFWNRHFFLSRLVFLIIYLRDVNTHTKTKENVSLKASLAPAPSSAVLRYSCITINDSRTPIVKLRQMADLFSKMFFVFWRNVFRNCSSKDEEIKLNSKAGFTLVRCCYYEGTSRGGK